MTVQLSFKQYQDQQKNGWPIFKAQYCICTKKFSSNKIKSICKCNFCGKNISIHRLIAQTFIPNPENKPCVNHKNGIRSDNRIENLEWCTYSENTLHRTRILKTGIGEKQRCAKLKSSDIPVIREELANGVSPYEIAKRYNVSAKAIYQIKNKISWSHVN